MILVLALLACGDPPAPAPSTPVPAPAAPALPADADPALLDPTKATGQAPDTFSVRFDTTKGAFVVKATRAWAPLGVDRFHALVRIHYYDDTAFHRVVGGRVAQFGISGYEGVNTAWKRARIHDDPRKQSNTRGRVTFAQGGPDRRIAQVFVNLTDNTDLDGMGYAPFGEVVSGMDVVDALFSGYGESGPRGDGPDPALLAIKGNTWLHAEFPKLDYVKTAVLVP